MARLTQDQIETHLEWLSDWRTPDGVFAYVGDINEWMGSEDFFNQPGTTFLRDALSGAALAKARGIEEVRLIRDEWPDIELRSAYGMERVECVEADLPGRQRGREYRDAAKATRPFDVLVELDEGGQAENERSQVPLALQMAATKKAEKSYPPGVSLAILLNIYSRSWGRPDCPDPLIAEFGEWTKAAAGKFDKVWVLWEGVAHGPYHERTQARTKNREESGSE